MPAQAGIYEKKMLYFLKPRFIRGFFLAVLAWLVLIYLDIKNKKKKQPNYMKTIIVGAGDIGTNIARHLVMENHSVVMIDNDDERLARVNDTIDVQTIHGMGCHPDVLEQAGCGSADMLIAVTKSDEVNMVACQMAYSLFDVPKKIARVRHASYLKLIRGHLFTDDNMPVDVIISPEVEVAKSILQTLDVPGAFDATVFADNEVSLIGVRLPKTSPVMHIPMKHLTTSSNLEFIVVAIYRHGRVIIPRGSDHIEPGDEVYLVCPKKENDHVMSFLGFESHKNVEKAFIIGGGQLGLELCKNFEKRGVDVQILENDMTRAEYLSEYLEDTMVIHGDAIDKDLYEQEAVATADVVLSATDDDSVNILSSALAKQVGAKNIITRINRNNFMPLVTSVDLQKIVSPLEITASKILQHVRKGEVIHVHTINDGNAQMIEAMVHYESHIAGMKLKDIKLPNGVAFCAIYNSNGVVLPRPDTIIQVDDRVILFSTVENISVVDKLF